MSITKRDGAAVTGGEQFVFVPIAAMPDRSDGVDHVPRRQAVSSGDLGIAGLATVKPAAFGQQFRAGGPVDRAIDPTAAEQGFVGGVDDGVNAQACDVADDDFKPGRTDLMDRNGQAEAAAFTVTPLSASSCCNSPAWNISRMISQPPTNSPLT